MTTAHRHRRHFHYHREPNRLLLGTTWITHPSTSSLAQTDTRSGCCIFHPHIQLRKKSMLRGWKVVLAFCPECADETRRSIVEKSSASSSRSEETARRIGRSSIARVNIKSKGKGNEKIKSKSSENCKISFDRERTLQIHPAANYYYNPAKNDNHIGNAKAKGCDSATKSTAHFHHFAKRNSALKSNGNFGKSNDHPTTNLPDPPSPMSRNVSSSATILASQAGNIQSTPHVRPRAQRHNHFFRRSSAPFRMLTSNESSASAKSVDPEGLVLPPTFLYNRIAKSDCKHGDRKAIASNEDRKKNASSGGHVAKSGWQGMQKNYNNDAHQSQHLKVVNTPRKNDAPEKGTNPLDRKNSHNSGKTSKISDKVEALPSTSRSRGKAPVNMEASAREDNLDSNTRETREEMDQRGGELFVRQELETDRSSSTRASNHPRIGPRCAQQVPSRFSSSAISQSKVAPDPETSVISIHLSMSSSKAKQRGNNTKNVLNASKFSKTLPTMDEDNPYIMSPSNPNQNFHCETQPRDGELSKQEGRASLEPIIYVQKTRCVDSGKSFLSTTSSFTQSVSCFHCVEENSDCGGSDDDDDDEVGVFDPDEPEANRDNEIDVEAGFERMKEIVRRMSPQNATDHWDENLRGNCEIDPQDLIRELHRLHSDLCG